MKTLKIIKAVMLSGLIAVMAACSDSYNATAPAEGKNEVNSLQEGSALSRNLQTKLGPDQSIELSSDEFGYHSITSYAVDILFPPDEDRYAQDCADLLIESDSSNDFKLSCHEHYVKLKKLVIRNTGDRTLALNIHFTGERSGDIYDTVRK